MRNWQVNAPPKDIDPRIFQILAQLRTFVSQAQSGFASISRGESPDGGAAPLGVTDHGLLNGLSDDDHPQYLLLAGRTGGQTVFGDGATSGTSVTPVLILANFNNSAVTGAQRITLQGGGSGSGQIKIETNQLLLVERAGSTGWSFFTGIGFVNLSATGSASFTGVLSSNPVLAANHGAAGLTNVTFLVKAANGQTGHMTDWRNSVDSVLSFIRASDGAFVGPIAPLTSDEHPDNIFRVVGSVTATKKVALEVDGLTAATTRTLTVPDWDGTIAAPVGLGSSGQVLTSTGATQPSWQTPAAGGAVSIARTLALMGA